MRRIALPLIAGVAILYAADYVLAKVSSKGSFSVEKDYAVKQKDGKYEYYFDPPAPEECVNSLAPHFGERPCWYVSRHPKRTVTL